MRYLPFLPRRLASRRAHRGRGRIDGMRKCAHSVADSIWDHHLLRSGEREHGVAIPTFQEIMLPFMELTADGAEHQLQAVIARLADDSGLTDDERAELLPSGFQATFTNRVAWASTHLRKAGLLERTGRGRYRITERGKAVLQARPDGITMKTLRAFPEYREFQHGTASGSADSTAARHGVDENATPAEAIEALANELNSGLAQEVLDRVRAAPPDFFERLVVELLVQLGYGGSRADAGQAVGRTGDGGIDGIIKEDRLGLDVVYIQAKRWERNVGGPEVREFAGSLEDRRASKGVLITTSGFTADARASVLRMGKRIVLIDGKELARLMIDSGIGVSTVSTYALRRIDEGYFEPS
jgi:restriction system protein